MFAKSTKGQVLYIRHGETHYNRKLSESEVPREVKTDEKLIDSSLCEDGVKQVRRLADDLTDLNIKTVFCSPLNRCLETALLSLRSHPCKHKIKVIVHPHISEVIQGAQDIPKDIYKKKEVYNQNSEVIFDWSYFDSHYREKSEAECYFLNYVDNVNSDDDVTRTLIKHIKEKEEKKGLYSKLLSHYADNNKRLESLQHLFKRSQEFKFFLRRFLSENQINDESKVLVLTHSAFIRMSTTQMAYQMEVVDCYPEDCYRPDNCEVISLNLDL